VSTISRMQDHGAIANVVGPEPQERPHGASLPTTEHCVRALHEVRAPTAMAVRARISGLGSSTLSKDGSWVPSIHVACWYPTVADCLPRPRLWLAMTSGRLARCLDKWSRMPPPFGNAVPFEGGKPMVKGGARLVHPFVPNLCTCFVCIVLPVAARRRYAMLRC
jgi:hypothetical protein